MGTHSLLIIQIPPQAVSLTCTLLAGCIYVSSKLLVSHNIHYVDSEVHIFHMLHCGTYVHSDSLMTINP